MKRFLALLLCLLLMLTAVAGCGNADKDPDTSANNSGAIIPDSSDDTVPDGTDAEDSTVPDTSDDAAGIPDSSDADNTDNGGNNGGTNNGGSGNSTTTGGGGSKPTTTVKPDGFVHTDIAGARAAQTGTKLHVSGVVARITYSFGMKPAGLMLVDGTGSIYVYDSTVAAAVKVGNTITIKGSKAYWVLDTEQSNAAKFSYKGCNQIEKATLVSNDGKVSDFSKKGIPSATVKEIMDTPVSQDITSKVYKVTALVKKAPGKGFTNYYINDLDGQTGSYVYTQCNGSDFSWLDKFDGQICTVYLTALNAKSSSAGCVWRFLPIDVKNEGFDPKSVNVAEFAVKYYGLPQFLTAYTGDPALQLTSSVDNDLLKFSGAKLTYASSDTKVATVSGNVLHCLSTGKVTITVTGTYGGKTYSGKVTINVTVNKTEQNYPTVKEAIAAKVGDKVTVRGIVGPSLVNKTGFYLIDKSGVIAVETSATVMDTIEIGHDVVLEATRGLNTKDKDYGQTCLKDATVKVNQYGNNPYPTDAFKGNISVADFYALPITTDYTTCVYTMKATVKVEESTYYSNISLTDGKTTVRLYCSSANQYNWLKAYAGQEVTVEIAACNWNSKNYYTGCVLAVVKADGTKVYNDLNFN